MRWFLLLALAACDPLSSTDKPGVSPSDEENNDADEDGFTPEEGDCDDTKAEVNPAGAEVCDGVDQDCDGEIDEDVLLLAYSDADGDGYGDSASETSVCTLELGQVTTGGDCNDGNPSISPAAAEICNALDDNCDGQVDEGVTTTFYADADADGQGDPAAPHAACDVPAGYVESDADCDDSRADVYQGGEEVCDNADNDCDGGVDDGVTTDYYIDLDSDGFGSPDAVQPACSVPTGYASNANDCDDTSADVSPVASELCNGIDDDCNGEVDEPAAVDAGTWFADADADTFGDPAVASTACEAPAGFVSNDDDCDDTDAALNPDTVWYLDADSDGYGQSDFALVQCIQPAGYVADSTDCNNLDATVNPAQPEICNGVDDNCDGAVDDDDTSVSDQTIWYADTDSDGYGDNTVPLLACNKPSGFSADNTDCDDTNLDVSPAAAERCNGIDDDCDTLVDDADEAVLDTTLWYADADADTFGDDSIAFAACDQPAGFVEDANDCDDESGAVNPAASEICNDIDDDCDGRADDDDDDTIDATVWYADSDADAYGDPSTPFIACIQPPSFIIDNTDCDDTDASIYPGADESWYDGVDHDCDGLDDPSVCDEIPLATTIAVSAACVEPFGGSWTVATEWTTDSTSFTYATGAGYTEVMAAPSVGNLTDDNGDSIVDSLDIPDVVYTTFTGSSYSGTGYLRVISGDDGTEVLSIRSMTIGSTTFTVAGAAAVALGDLDGDGSPDIVTLSSGGDVLAFESDGTAKWAYDTSKSTYLPPHIADMDGDGNAEVLVGTTLLSSSGTLLATCGAYSDGYPSLAADIDGDGLLEMVGGDGVCDHTGSTVWSTTRTTGYAGVGNFDADEALELVNVDAGNSRIDLIDDNGTLLWSYSNGSGGGPPVVGDFDGDGELEIGVSGSTTFTVIGPTGSKEWSVTIDDSSSKSTSATAFDFDADGALEIVYADESELYVWDGATGAELYNTTDHASGTIREHPVVADIDRDGQAEIVLASNDYTFSGWDGIHVLGAGPGEWPSAGLRFNQHAYLVDLWDDSLQAGDPTADWNIHQRLRGQTGFATDPGAVADLSPTILGVCEDCTSGTATVYVSVDNTGAVFAPVGVVLTLYAVNGSTFTELDSLDLRTSIEPGERTYPVSFEVNLADVGTDGLWVEVDEAGDVHECDVGNNGADWVGSLCR